jgi:branched-chain amino acid transport system permease protein
VHDGAEVRGAASDEGNRGRSRRRIALLVRLLLSLGALAAILCVPYLTDDYITGLFVNMAIFAVVTMSWNLVFGYAGVFSLGQMAFFAVGGYAAALANIHWDFSPWAGLFFGGLVAGVAGLAMGIPSLRLYGPYMVLFTLAFQLVLLGLINTVWTETTGGTAGLFGISVFSVGNADPVAVGFYAGVVMVVVTFVLIALLLRSPIGRAIEVLKEGHGQAEARGISLFQHRVIVFVMSSFLTGVAGAFYAHYFGIITPTVLGVGLLINLLAWMVMGGLGTQLGPIIGAGLGVYLNDSLAQTQEYSQLIWGLILVGIVALAPGGIVTTGGSILRWLLQLGVSLFKADEARPPMPQVVGTLSGMGRRARVGIDWIAGHRVK